METSGKQTMQPVPRRGNHMPHMEELVQASLRMETAVSSQRECGDSCTASEKYPARRVLVGGGNVSYYLFLWKYVAVSAGERQAPKPSPTNPSLHSLLQLFLERTCQSNIRMWLIPSPQKEISACWWSRCYWMLGRAASRLVWSHFL